MSNCAGFTLQAGGQCEGHVGAGDLVREMKLRNAWKETVECDSALSILCQMALQD